MVILILMRVACAPKPQSAVPVRPANVPCAVSRMHVATMDLLCHTVRGVTAAVPFFIGVCQLPFVPRLRAER